MKILSLAFLYKIFIIIAAASTFNHYVISGLPLNQINSGKRGLDNNFDNNELAIANNNALKINNDYPITNFLNNPVKNLTNKNHKKLPRRHKRNIYNNHIHNKRSTVTKRNLADKKLKEYLKKLKNPIVIDVYQARELILAESKRFDDHPK